MQSPRGKVSSRCLQATAEGSLVRKSGIEGTNGNEPIPEADKVTLENLIPVDGDWEAPKRSCCLLHL